MEETLRIDNIRLYTRATDLDLKKAQAFLQAEDSATLLMLPVPEDGDWFLGLVLAKYYTSVLSQCVGVRDTKTDGNFYVLHIKAVAIRSFFSSLMRRMRLPSPVQPVQPPQENASLHALDELLGVVREQEPPKSSPRCGSAQHFLQNYSPAKIQGQLSEYIVGQAEVTRAVADFLYYHALRQVHPNLPQRPLLISGPSGSGKTEVWRTAHKLYGHIFPIRIIDGSNLSCEGWAGNYKLDTYIDATLAEGGILVVDEFDKLTKPKHSASGDNVSLDMQSEFLKLIEGEYLITEKRKQTNLSSKKMGFVLVGAFESLRAKKSKAATRQVQPIGFRAEAPAAATPSETLTDDDFIAYGILPEIVGRIAVKCACRVLPDSAYLDILRGPHSRVAQLEQVLRSYGIPVSQVISNEALIALVRASKNNHTGVRWVSAQVESRLLEAIYEQGLYQDHAAAS